MKIGLVECVVVECERVKIEVELGVDGSLKVAVGSDEGEVVGLVKT